MPQTLSPAEIAVLLKPKMSVYLPGTVSESLVVAEALKSAPDACAGVHFTGVWLPGINRTDYAGLHETAGATAFFVGRELHESFAAGRIEYLPWSYFEVYRALRDQLKFDLAFFQVSPPDQSGQMSLGLANDFSPALLAKDTIKVAHINPAMPRTRGAASLNLKDVDYSVEADGPLITDHPVADETWSAIGRQIANVLRDGDTLEVGIGRVQSVFSAFAGARRLRLHSGAVSSTLMSLIEAGSIADDDGVITAGIALGDSSFHAFIADNPLFRFAPVGETHDIETLRRIPRFVAINGVIEVDLFGQANAEMVSGRQVSGAGGLVDFMRGARLSPGGCGIVALPATSGGGTTSRIVSRLDPGTAVSIARGDMDMVATEYGVAELRMKSVNARAEALISIAAPDFRDSLSAAWRDIRKRL
ncbi:MAG: hypothetical protein H6905_08060 [Hyphomicrobiales bacterium]|nr:hypothetical protein [Hyphomicrobiales bacterium]